MTEPSALTQQVKWNEQGLVPAIAQDWQTGEVLMLAWMNSDALELTMREDRAIYWSRSRQALWRKGEESGHVQHLKELRIDCDADTILMKVEQVGGIACHTGRRSCFYRVLEGSDLRVTDEILMRPDEIYGKEPSTRRKT
ncbi:MAG: phosphoribosyl-AMP cyclohydrolase [Gammaproteobacteria bacterium]|nr:MAG: phosphoribosyl-AMP cyclohydrolase [Gammaproteobacteria bacterium]RLA55673.1 MAG: phosphoribosyl-AMP cyclohydrolase [Gammaproteobacteria bacterium]HDY82460.1 phosphoribosyl-AMP cyclohydrolase [Halieaceae bacterium]